MKKLQEIKKNKKSIDSKSYAGEYLNFRRSNQDSEIYGSNGNDTIFGSFGNNKIYGQQGNDLIYGFAGNDTIYGGKGNDTIIGGNGNNKLYGDEGNDILRGGKDNDTITGGKGNDIIHTGKGNNTVIINKGDGHDTIYHEGDKTLIDIQDFHEFDNDLSFSKKNNDLTLTYSRFDKTKEQITIKDYFTPNGKTAINEVSLKTDPVMVVAMYAVPPIYVEPQDVIYVQPPLMKYAPPEYFNSDHITHVEAIDGFLVVAKYALPPLGDEITTGNSDYDSDHSPVEDVSLQQANEIPVVNSGSENLNSIVEFQEILKYGIPPIYGYTRDEVDLTTLLNINGITVNTDKPGKIYGTEYDDIIKGSKGNDTIIAGNGDDKIYAKKGNDIINAGKGINILYFAKNDGKNTVINGKGTDILIVKNDKFSNLKAKFSGNNLILKYTGGEIILKDYKKGEHSAKYIQVGEKRKAIEDILPAHKKVNRITVSNSAIKPSDTGMLKSEVSEWSAANSALSETIYASENNPDSINAILGTENFDPKINN